MNNRNRRLWRYLLVLATVVVSYLGSKITTKTTKNAQIPLDIPCGESSFIAGLRKLSVGPHRYLLNDKQDGVEVGTVRSDPIDATGTTTTATTTHRPPPHHVTQNGAIIEPSESDAGPWNAMAWLLKNSDVNHTDASISSTTAGTTRDRCEWLWNEFEQHNRWMTPDQRADRYQNQATDASTYYRASSHIFWVDFVQGNWSQALRSSQLASPSSSTLDVLSALDEYATYTWVSGDLHLLNLGAWKNRRGDIVFGMNDFDEGAVHDFQVDVMRLVISIYDQVVEMKKMFPDMNEGMDAARRVVQVFAKAYVSTVLSYVGNEDALITELTTETAVGSLKAFLESLRDDEDYSREAQLEKYAKLHKGRWTLDKGTKKKPKHKLAKVSSKKESKIRQAFSATEYGGTLLKFGSSLMGRWDDQFYEVLDVAARLGSGIGSYGVDRYYVLIRGGSSKSDDESSNDEAGPFILDVKHQPPGSFREIVSPSDAAWYDQHFVHSAARATEAQRKLTAFTDRFTGWLLIDDDDDDDDDEENSPSQPFTVRERSPWKENFDLDSLLSSDGNVDLLEEFMTQVAFTTATSHVRGNVAQAPGDFKNVIHTLLGDPSRLEEWSAAVVDIASLYHEQVRVDFECFQSRVREHYPS